MQVPLAHCIVIYTTIGALSTKICSQNRTGFLPARSQFDTNHRVNFTTPTCCLSATFGPLAFCVCPLFLRQKIKKNFPSPHLRYLDAIFMRRSSRRCRHRRLLRTAHDFARLRTTKNNGRFYSFINTISFHGSRRFIFTGSCSAPHGLLLSQYLLMTKQYPTGTIHTSFKTQYWLRGQI